MVKVGIHPGSVLSPLFIMVLEALLYADDLVLIAESILS